MWTPTSLSTRSSSKASRNNKRPANSPSSGRKDREAVNLRVRAAAVTQAPEDPGARVVTGAETIEIILRAPAVVEAVRVSRKKRKMMAER